MSHLPPRTRGSHSHKETSWMVQCGIIPTSPYLKRGAGVRGGPGPSSICLVFHGFSLPQKRKMECQKMDFQGSQYPLPQFHFQGRGGDYAENPLFGWTIFSGEPYLKGQAYSYNPQNGLITMTFVACLTTVATHLPDVPNRPFKSLGA